MLPSLAAGQPPEVLLQRDAASSTSPVLGRAPIHLRFHSIEQLAQLLAKEVYPLEVMQLTAGQLRGRLLKIDCQPLEIMLIQASLPILARGSKPHLWLQCGINLAPIPSGPVELQTHGDPVSSEDLYGLKPHSEAYLITPAGFSGIFLTMPRQLFFSMADEIGLPDLETPLKRINTLKIEPARMESLRQVLREALRLAVRQPQMVSQPAFRHWLLAELLPLLQESLVDGLARRGRLKVEAPPRIELVKVVDAWLRAHPDRDINLNELCEQVFASRRTVIRGFQEHLNMGPMQFFKLYRLHLLRQKLIEGDHRHTQIAGTAASLGFFSQGHFARDYRTLFGELPSETLRRRD